MSICIENLFHLYKIQETNPMLYSYDKTLTWYPCVAGAMPEDIIPGSIQKTDSGMLRINHLLCASALEKGTRLYYVQNRFKRGNADHWEWAGGHPAWWALVEDPES